MTHLYHHVKHTDDLPALLEAVRAQDTVALDTEADSLHHYREKLCLIQLGTGEEQWIVDPLGELAEELSELLHLLEARTLLLHGADYDLRLLYRAYHFKPARIFDTMLAAQLLGRQRIGLAALVEEICGVVLAKKGQKADWSKRPLTADLLEYASDDTRYLPRVVEALGAELVARRRTDWHEELCRRQIESARQTRSADGVDPWRIKGGKHLQGRSAAVLRELWQWREEIARHDDKPPFKVVGNELLLQYALWTAETPGATYAIAPEPPGWLRGSRLRGFEESLKRALELPPGQWPAARPARGVSRRAQDEELLLGRVLAARDAIARELGLDPGVMGSRETLREVVRHRPRRLEELEALGGLMHWQVEELGEAILEALASSPAEGADPDEAAFGSGLESGLE